MRFIDRSRDTWRSLGGDDGPPVSITPAPYLLLDLAQWHGGRAAWPVSMPVEVLEPDLPRLRLVALQFPKWVDGRAYSQARLLRSRFRFKDQIRATGEVLVDMLPLLQRTGFDAAVLRADQSLAAAERALSFFPGHYQGDALDNRPLFAQAPGTAEALARKPAREFVGDGADI
jgi:uncharacterized protein (DUF934 family)